MAEEEQLLRLAAYTGDARYEGAAIGTLALLADAMSEYPQAFGEALNAADMLVNGLTEVAIVGNPTQAITRDMLTRINAGYYPNVIRALSRSDVDGEASIRLLSHRSQQNGQPTAYVCRHFVCNNPVTSADALAGLLRPEHT